MGERSTIEGTVENVVFQNEENGYTVLSLLTDQGEVVTVVGCIPFAAAGESMTVTGVWVNHPTYGVQMTAELVERRMPQDEEGIICYLASGVLKGVGPATATRLVDKFGADTLRIIEEEPEKPDHPEGHHLQEGHGDLQAAFRSLTGLRRVMEFLSRYDLPVTLAMGLLRAYGDETLEKLKDNPYLLTDERCGVDFSAADEIALAMGFDGDSPCRTEAAVLYELNHNLSNGHVFLPRPKLLAATMELIGVDGEAVEKALDDLCERGAIVCRPIANVQGCYLRRMYEAEVYVAKRLAAACGDDWDCGKNVDRIIDDIQKQQGVAYAPEQRRAVALAAERGILLLTGGPGTGKTTSVRGIVTLFERMGLDVLLLAPTGRAAQRMSQLCGRDAQTVHRALGMSWNELTGEVTFRKNEKEPLEADAVIVDEMSMVDLELMASLLRAMRPGCRLVMVGDPDQLPSVGAGNVLGDLLRSGVIPSVSLTEILPSGGKKRHHPQRPRGEYRPSAGAEKHPERLFLPVPPCARPAGADGGGAVPAAAAQQHGHPGGADPGAVPHPQGRVRHGESEPCPTGGAEPACRRKAAEAVGRHGVPGGRPGDADPQQLRRGVGEG